MRTPPISATKKAQSNCKILLLEPPQLGAKGGETGAHNLRYAAVVSIRDDSKQLFNTLASDRGYDPELSQVSTDALITRSAGG